MANILSPFGFQHYQGGAGGVPTFAMQKRRIASGNSTAIFAGDPVMPVIGSATGYITQAAAGTTTLAGVFWGCEYISVAQKRKVWSNYWPGSDANGDVTAYVIDDPNSRFKVQTSGASFYNTSASSSIITSLPIGQYAQFTIGTGSTANGLSGAYLSSVGTTVTFPFIIIDYLFDPPGQNGTDPTTNYPVVVVGFNNEILRSNGAGPTGIS
jgi:hypothetical protein